MLTTGNAPARKRRERKMANVKVKLLVDMVCGRAGKTVSMLPSDAARAVQLRRAVRVEKAKGADKGKGRGKGAKGNEPDED